MKRLHLAAFTIALYTLSFIIIEWSGVFSERTPEVRGILTFWIVLFAATAIAVLLLVSAALNHKRMRPAHWVGLLSVVLMATGIWSIRLFDFAIDVVLTEGQFYKTDQHRSMGLLYAGMISPVPKIMTRLEEVELTQRGQAARARAKGTFLLQAPGWTAPRPVTLSQGTPRLQGGIFLSIRNFGYSPRYVIKKAGRVLESDFISMRLYPFGSEDYFRLLSPHTFFVRYYPGHQENGEERTLKIKIARNKDIIFNGYAAFNEEITFEDATISFAEIRKWVEVSISRNWGALTAWAGLTLGCVSLILLAMQRFKGRSS